VSVVSQNLERQDTLDKWLRPNTDRENPQQGFLGESSSKTMVIGGLSWHIGRMGWHVLD
jgi:hypothetical protein